jgi:hypothetical protein
LQGPDRNEPSQEQEETLSDKISEKDERQQLQLLESLSEQTLVHTSLSVLPADEPSSKITEKQKSEGSSDPEQAESPSYSLISSQEDESVSHSHLADEVYYPLISHEISGIDQPLTPTLFATSSNESSKAVAGERKSEDSPDDELTYPSLTISDIDRSPGKLKDDSIVDEQIAQKSETIQFSDVSQLNQAGSDNHQTLEFELQQAESVFLETHMKPFKLGDFDITEGLQLGPRSSRESRASQSPAGILKTIPTDIDNDVVALDEDLSLSSPDELTMDFDATETLVMTHLEDDKARLRSFLNRAAANKASKVATTHRRESAQSRRDSDIIRKALASPRPVLEDKDTNLSPTRNLDFLTEPTMSLDKIIASPLRRMKQAPDTTDLDPDALNSKNNDTMELDLQPGSPRRRSKRTQSRIPHPPSTMTVNTPNKIPVRTDGSERVILNRTEAQELANLLRKNTRKNKGGAISVPERLLKLRAEATLSMITDGGFAANSMQELKEGAKGVRWREQLVEFSDSVATADLEHAAAAETTVTTSNVDTDVPTVKEKKPSTSRLRRLKGVGGINGTPAKGLLSSTLLPDEAEEDAAAAAAQVKAAAAPPMTEEVKKQTKSRLQPPKKLMLNPSAVSLSGLPVLAGKENALQWLSPAKKIGAPGKGKIPVPTSTVMGDGMGARPVKRLRAPRKL